MYLFIYIYHDYDISSIIKLCSDFELLMILLPDTNRLYIVDLRLGQSFSDTCTHTLYHHILARIKYFFGKISYQQICENKQNSILFCCNILFFCNVLWNHGGHGRPGYHCTMFIGRLICSTKYPNIVVE